ncbi:MAG: histidine kinase [Cytophagales bacterium]|nr:histidine kinase [Cytophagales bacterium]
MNICQEFEKRLGKRFLLLLAVFNLVFGLFIEIIRWHFTNSLSFSWSEFASSYWVNYFNLLVITSLYYFSVRYTQKRFTEYVLIRLVLEIILLSGITCLWIVGINFFIQRLIGQNPLMVQKIYFLCAIGVLLTIMFVPFFEFIFQNERNYNERIWREGLEKENARIQYENLKNQINPHFLFNNLNSLNSLISLDPLKAKRFLTSLSQVIRHVLDFRNVEAVSLKSELIFLENYLFMLHTRYEDALQVIVNISEEDSNKLLLPMVVQLLIENAVKHNKMTEQEPLHITIESSEEGVLVRNSLNPKASCSSWGLGLSNIKNRYAKFDLIVVISRESDSFSVKVPYLKSESAC